MISILLTALLIIIIDDHSSWTALVISFGFTHYLLSFYYASGRIKTLLSSTSLRLPLVSLGLLLLVIYHLEFPLVIFFGLHHAFNEGYLRQYQHRNTDSGDSQLPAFRTLFHIAAYFCILRHEPYVNELPEIILWLTLAISSWLYLNALRIENNKQGLWEAVKESSIEILFLLLVLVSFWINITFLQMVLYHFVLWTLVPIPVLKQQGSFKLAEYGLFTVAGLLLFLSLTMSYLFSEMWTLSFMLSQFYIWSYVHIASSFALSSAHPNWLVQLFRADQPAQ